LGYGWTLNVTGTDLRFHRPPQTGITQAPGYQDGNLLYVTTPMACSTPLNSSPNPQQLADNPLAA